MTINAGIAGQVPAPLCASLVPSSQGKCRDQAHFTGEEAGAPERLSDSPRADAWKWGRRICPRHLGPKPSVTAGLPASQLRVVELLRQRALWDLEPALPLPGWARVLSGGPGPLPATGT